MERANGRSLEHASSVADSILSGITGPPVDLASVEGLNQPVVTCSVVFVCRVGTDVVEVGLLGCFRWNSRSLALGELSECFQLGCRHALNGAVNGPFDALGARRRREGAIVLPEAILFDYVSQEKVHVDLLLRVLVEVEPVTETLEVAGDEVILDVFCVVKEKADDCVVAISILAHKMCLSSVVNSVDSMLRGSVPVDLQRGEGRRLICAVSSGDCGRLRPGAESELPIGLHVRGRKVSPGLGVRVQALNRDVQVLVLDEAGAGRR